LDITFTQEVTGTGVLNVRGYNTYLNIGAFIGGTAILAKSTLHLTNITTLPSGRTIAADYEGIRLINVYAPSGTARRTDREQFYTTELPYLFHDGPTDLIIGCDFNCVLHPGETTEQFQTSRALREIIRGLELHEAWNQNPPPYIHILLPPWCHEIKSFLHNLRNTAKKMGIEIIPPAFTDHYAVAMRITVEDTDLQRARGRWKMGSILIIDEHLKKRISFTWVNRHNHVVGEVFKNTPSYPHPQRTA